jgi:acyl carrier protein
MPPLRGVIHAALVLDDCSIADLSRERLETVMHPKALGAWNLHQCTLDLQLDFFLLLSSISAYLGSPGQASYATANAYLDGLAHQRHRMGLPAISINFGEIGQVGVVARNPHIERYLHRIGSRPISPKQAVHMLGAILDHEYIHASVFDMDWTSWGRSGIPMASAPLCRHLVAEAGATDPEQGDPAKFRQHLLAMTSEERIDYIAVFLQHLLARVTRLPVDQLGVDAKLDQLGIDSLMIFELNTFIRLETGKSFSSAILMQEPSIAQLAEHLVEMIIPEDVRSELVAELSEADLEHLLYDLITKQDEGAHER